MRRRRTGVDLVTAETWDDATKAEADHDALQAARDWIDKHSD